MKKEIFDLIKKEGIYLLAILLLIFTVFKIAFYSDSFIVVLRSALAILFMFVVPGYFGMLFWHEKLDFTQRIIVGTSVAAGLIGTISYYLGLVGLNIKYHTILLPALIIVLGYLLALTKKQE